MKFDFYFIDAGLAAFNVKLMGGGASSKRGKVM
jgi:hypothetical protein